MRLQINKNEILMLVEETSSYKSNKIPETTKLLNSFADKLKKKGIKNYLLIADDKKHPLGGASNVSINDTRVKSPIPMLDKKFKEWKIKHGISIEHDWRKDGNSNLNKGLK